MVKVVLISHGDYASHLLQSAEMIVGQQEQVVVLALAWDQGLEGFAQRVGAVLAEHGDREGVLVLTDLFGGTPTNAACLASLGGGSPPGSVPPSLALVTGVNLPMLLEVFTARPSSYLTALKELALLSGREGIRTVEAVL